MGTYSIVQFVLFIAFNTSYYLVLKRLKSHHVETYMELGSPVFFNDSIRQFSGVVEFIIKRRHVVLKDPFLSKACNCCILTFLTFLTLLFLFIYGGISKH